VQDKLKADGHAIDKLKKKKKGSKDVKGSSSKTGELHERT